MALCLNVHECSLGPAGPRGVEQTCPWRVSLGDSSLLNFWKDLGFSWGLSLMVLYREWFRNEGIVCPGGKYLLKLAVRARNHRLRQMGGWSSTDARNTPLSVLKDERKCCRSETLRRI